MDKNKDKKIGIHTILPIFISSDEKDFDAQFERAKEIHKKEGKDYDLVRGHDILVICGGEQRGFSLKKFKKLMGFKL
jgi:hypothetical protein